MYRRPPWLSILLLLIFSNTLLLGQDQTEEPWTFAILESNKQQLLVELILPSFGSETVTHDSQSYQRLHVDHWGRWGKPGQPELPAYSTLVGMPHSGEPQISVIEIQEEILAGYHLYPRPNFVEGITPQGLDFVEVFTFDAEAYGRATSYPGISAEAVDEGFLRDQPLFRLKIYPFQYNPIRQTLTVARRMKVLITFPVAPISGSSVIEGTSPAFRNILKNTVINYDDLPQAEAPDPTSNIQGASVTGANYLIITHPNFYDALQELKTYREEQGMSVFIKKTDEIYNEFSGGQKKPEAIRDYLENAFENWSTKPEYVLLVGDANYSAVIIDPNNPTSVKDYDESVVTDYLPSHYEATLGFYDPLADPKDRRLTPIDAWYAKLNSFTTENGEVKDDYFDVFIGRIPARSSADVRTVINKIKAYEQTPQAGDWARKAVLVADDGKSSTGEAEGERFRNDMNFLADSLPRSLRTTKLYNYTPSTSVAQEIDTGVLLLAYSGHGSETSWASWEGNSQAIYRKSNISNLSNENKLPIVIATNCSNGYFAASDTSRVLAEQFLLVSNKGSIAALASAAFSYPSVNSIMIEALSESIFEDNDLIMGSATTTARLKAINNDDEVNPPNNLFEMFTYFGDPALHLNLPPTLTLAGQESSNTVATGETITYQLNYGVSGVNKSRDLTLVNTLPNHVTYQSASIPPSSIDGQKLTWNFGDVAKGNGSVMITALVNKSGLLDGQIISNIAQLYDLHGGAKTVWLNAEVVVNDIPPEITSITSLSPDRLGQITQFTTSMAKGTNLSYVWNFGDGATSDIKNPSHIYAAAGTYTATLTVSNGVGSDQAAIQIKIKAPEELVEQPIANFMSDTPNQLGQTTVFINNSQDGGDAPKNIIYTWNFGDGNSSNVIHPLYTYETVGNYLVSLTIINLVGSDTFTDIVTIEPSPHNDKGKKVYFPLLMKK